MPQFEKLGATLKTFAQKSFSARAWDWQTIGLALVLVQSAAIRLTITEWAPKLEVIQSVSFFAVILGLALGYSSFSRKISIWLACEYAALIVPMRLLSALDRAERTAFVSNDLGNLLLRLFDALALFFRNQPIYDTLFFIALASLGFWIVGCVVGYRLARHGSYLEAIFIPGATFLIVHIYDAWLPARAWGLAFFIFVALALAGRAHYLENQKAWKQKRVFLSSDTEWEFSRSIFYSAALLVFIAWVLPGALSAVKPAAKAWRQLIAPLTDRFANSVKALKSPYSLIPNGDYYGSELKLGSEAPTSDTPVLYIEAPKSGAEIVRYYWRGRTYDTYLNGQWSNANAQQRTYNPEFDQLEVEGIDTRQTVQLKFTINFQKQELLYAPAETTWINRAGKLIVAPMGTGRQEALGFIADPGLVAGNSYTVRALIAAPTVEDLRNAGVEYPAWVTERYLQVPEKIAPRLKALATEIAADQATPFDRAQAITLYLRKTIKYQASLEESPGLNQDPTLWVLFDYKQGFCVYYASAEILLLRTLGIPARMAVGFAQGTYDKDRERYTVTHLNAHAWPEVYFPGIGWVEFEPTSNQDSLTRPSAPRNSTDTDSGLAKPPLIKMDDADSSAGFEPNEDESVPTATRTNTMQWLKALYFTLTIGLIGLIVYFSKRYALAKRIPVYLVSRYQKHGAAPPLWIAYWADWERLLPIEKTYQTLHFSLRWLGIKQPPHATPQERAAILTQILPAAEGEAQELIAQYQNAIFTARPADLKQARRAAWRILVKTWQARIFHYKEIAKRSYNIRI